MQVRFPSLKSSSWLWLFRKFFRGSGLDSRKSLLFGHSRFPGGGSTTDHNMVAFPAFKLAALLIKQISKPLANAMKARAKSSPFFRTYICMPPAQFYHWCEVKLKMWSMNLGKPVNVPKLNENMAIDLGAELVGEGIIFSIASIVLVYEYIRTSNKDALKELKHKEDIEKIRTELKDLYFATARQDAQIRELVRILRISLPSANYTDPQGNQIDMSNIPDHHRFGEKKEEESGLWASLNKAMWSAVDLILPPADSTKGTNGSDNNNSSQNSMVKFVGEQDSKSKSTSDDESAQPQSQSDPKTQPQSQPQTTPNPK